MVPDSVVLLIVDSTIETVLENSFYGKCPQGH